LFQEGEEMADWFSELEEKMKAKIKEELKDFLKEEPD
jgi:hypothetical protein